MDDINQKQEDRNKTYYFYQQFNYVLESQFTFIQGIIIIIQVLSLKIEMPNQSLDISQSLTQIIAYSWYLNYYTDKIVKLIKKSKDFENTNYRSLGKLIKLLNTQPKIDQDIYNSTGETDLLKGEISFENVYFKYPKTRDILSKMNQNCNEIKLNNTDKSRQVIQTDVKDFSQNLALQKQQSERDYALKDISFNIKQGQFVSFVGMSGSGKSTIVKILQRFYDADSGTILMDNKNVKDIPISKLRRSIGIVSQEPILFDNDIEYNITYGLQTMEYSQEDLQHICDASGVSEFVFDKERFPQGLKTLIGTKGVKLSGGQKQRVAIARALMKKPTILILDEATSSLDSESESEVQKYINQLACNKEITIIVVAHRLSTIIKSDIIFVMENGQIKEMGKHSQLIEKNGGIYQNLFNLQVNFQKNTQIL
ncbi:phosphate transport system ABC domain protein (macronuclear) [Tetrahymena thermophila SB210]|uniref:Phosphate transport system ABC domain protein n=1 Tax=Tetrahymena thermophila (strain SB210) TaxID=312017 RepID=I7MH30_TETTS|nr:phosphate transport system ABC domain protein [Tetrahymena thermophila SB210]EAR86009.2 phosphate transport system ABC domain protein [Tetrahymena thermophila SB210]|eukprot:XP_976604.2 phosphate transport system ABC domain protein [Tetrahymena thermophila SB210]